MATYYELVIKGDDRELIAYLSGFTAAAKIEGVFFAEEAGLHVQALRERIRHHGEVQHVICADRALLSVRDALARAAPRYRFEVKDERAIARASFTFEVETPSRRVAEEVRVTIAKPPRGVRVTGFQTRQIVDPSSKGPEIYSPVHEYVFAGTGDATGDVAGVITLRLLLCAIDFVKCNEIELHET